MATKKTLFRNISVEGSTPGTPMSRGPKPDARFNALLKALKTQELQGVREQLSRGLPVNYREPALGNKTPLICASERGFLEAVVELLGAGANVSIADAAGATPLHMAAGGGHLSTARLLLAHGAHVDPLDAHASTPLHYAARTDIQDPGSSSVIGVVEILLAAGARCGLRDGEGRLPLHNAATAGSAKLIKVLAAGPYKATINLKDNEGRTPLHCAVLGARSLDAVAAVLKLGCSIDARDSQGHTALHLAAKRQYNHVDDEFDGLCLELLLSHGASVAAKNDEGYNALSLAVLRTMWWGRPGARDHILDAVQQLVAKGSCIQDGFAMWRMVESFPSLVPVALNRSICANTSAHDSPHLRLDFDFHPLSVNAKHLREIHRQSPLNPQSELPPPLLGDSEVTMFHYILWAGRKRLLLHPLYKSFLHLKWSKVRNYFLANVIFYFFFVLSLTAFLLSSRNCPDNATHDNDTMSAPTITNYSIPASRNMTSVCRWAGEEAGVVGLTWWCLVIFSAFLDLREVVQLMQNPLIYLCNIGNLLDATLVFSVPQLLVGGSPEEETTNGQMAMCCLAVWQQRVGAIAIILAWVRLMLFTGQFPSCGVYIVMFSTVAKNVLKFLAMYMFVLVAFALGFYVLLRSLPTFRTPGTALITSLVMMTGELDYESTFLTEPSESSMLCIFLLVVFIVLVYIILSNLLVGLAVSDMYAIQHRSEILRLTQHVELMIQVETLFRNRLVPQKMQRCLLNSIAIMGSQQKLTVSVYPNRTRGFGEGLFLFLSKVIGTRRLLIKLFEMFVSGFIPPEYEVSLPSQLMREALDVALREHELDKRERLLHLRALQIGTTGHHKQNQSGQVAHVPINQTTLTRGSSYRRPTTTAVRSSWRWTLMSDTDSEDDTVNMLHAQPSVWAPHPAASQRTVIPDPNARLEELRNMVLSLQSTIESLTVVIQQRDTDQQLSSQIINSPDTEFTV
ncbi:transient receptor potential channel pyrexia-like isoform X2 [Homarus americanus]|uniref:transient receptor potential channel pyrexia-like isoform X2 n=1 Tax=Homarus americanus TaxID=6706 RepID=UPI001C44B945|nr:transient receptor potential channel pyrexia-like isoform X2 [Homarus americanus]